MSSEQLFSQACGLTDFLDVLSDSLKQKLVSLRDFVKQNRGNPVLSLGKTNAVGVETTLQKVIQVA